jgi:hypothetical protein
VQHLDAIAVFVKVVETGTSRRLGGAWARPRRR